DLLQLIDLKLDEAALLLPDIIDFNRKQEFQDVVVTRLRETLAKGTHKDLTSLLDWLRQQLSGMLPGDPLPATKTAIAHLCADWKRTSGAGALVSELERWANS